MWKVNAKKNLKVIFNISCDVEDTEGCIYIKKQEIGRCIKEGQVCPSLRIRAYDLEIEGDKW